MHRIAASLHMSSEFSLEAETCLSREVPTQCLCDVLAVSQWEKSELKYQSYRAWSGLQHPCVSTGTEIGQDFPDQEL